MASLKTLVFLQAYEDQYSSNSPRKSNFKWTREISNAAISSALSETFQIMPSSTLELFNGVRSLTQDNTTQYSLSLVPLNTSLYQLTNTGGTAAGFRTIRSIGTDATSQVTVTLNGPVLTYSFTGGTLPNLSSVQPGDEVLIGNLFNPANIGSTGVWQIISVTSSSISVVNPDGDAQGPITLGSQYATQLRIFSGTGVQIGDTLVISSGFSPVSQNSYKITLVTDYFVQFSYAGALPQEGPITTEVSVYSMAKSMIYMESDQNIEVLINGADAGPVIQPMISNGSPFPGLFLLNSTVWQLSISNNSINQANVTLLSVE